MTSPPADVKPEITGCGTKFITNPSTGEHTRIQSVDPLTHHVRTIGIHPGGGLLIAASIRDMQVRAGDGVRRAPAGLSVFRIADDGRLELVRKYDVELNGKMQWWAGFAALPA